MRTWVNWFPSNYPSPVILYNTIPTMSFSDRRDNGEESGVVEWGTLHSVNGNWCQKHSLDLVLKFHDM